MLELALPGQVFGWAMWVRQDGIAESAQAVEPTTVVVLDLNRLVDFQAFRKLGWRMLLELYGWLQESGLCPPNIQGWLRLKRQVVG